jgi:hypothetical protein
VISSLQGRYLHTGQHKHRINAHTDIHALSGIQTYDLSILAGEDSSATLARVRMAGAKRNNASSPQELVQLINPIINEPLNKFNQNPQGQKLIGYKGMLSHAALCMRISDFIYLCSALRYSCYRSVTV